MTPAPIKPTVSLKVLNQIDIRVGTIRGVNDVPNSDKLLQLRVSFGDHKRTIVAGMKTERANPQEIVGRQALFVVNMEPRKMQQYLNQRVDSRLSSRRPGSGSTPARTRRTAGRRGSRCPAGSPGGPGRTGCRRGGRTGGGSASSARPPGCAHRRRRHPGTSAARCRRGRPGPGRRAAPVRTRRRRGLRGAVRRAQTCRRGRAQGRGRDSPTPLQVTARRGHAGQREVRGQRLHRQFGGRPAGRKAVCGREMPPVEGPPGVRRIECGEDVVQH